MRKDWVYRHGDMYYADLGSGVGSEQGGMRPVVVIQNDVGNKYAPTLTVAPITSNLKKPNLPTHFIFYPDSVLTGPSMVMAEQTQTIDKQRIVSYVGKMSSTQMEGVMEAVSIHLGLKFGKTV